jgi:hypothetical protein
VHSKFCRPTVRVAGVSYRLWEILDVEALMEVEAAQKIDDAELRERKENRWRLVHSGHSGIG